MHYYEVAPIKLIRPDKAAFTYHSLAVLGRGQLVVVEAGRQEVIGVVVEEATKPDFKTKGILDTIDRPIPTQLIELAFWMSDYYHVHTSQALSLMVPPSPRKNRRQTKGASPLASNKRTSFLFNDEQLAALKELRGAGPGTTILQGVTGSGKTAIYIDLAKAAAKRGLSSIVLSPEIGLTSQLVDSFSAHFKSERLFVLHSSLTESERVAAWTAINNSTEPVVVVGARSALFAPAQQVGLIVLDEVHEPGYKQDQNPKYSALRAASVLGKLHGAQVVFGSATPGIAERYYAEQQGRPIIKLSSRARSNTTDPVLTTVDMTNHANFTGHRFLSRQLLEELELTLKSGKQALIFHNRRGTAGVGLCDNCGYMLNCPNCFVPLTLHADKHSLLCHICNHTQAVPPNCPNCHEAGIVFKGVGTKQIETELKKLFPKANIGRFDADNTKAETLGQRYDELHGGEIDIAIGTQVVAKGLDLPHLRLVGVVQADVGLSLPDFNSEERTFQLLSQVVGRVGRSHHKTKVVVQTYQLTHPSIKFGLSQDYEGFYGYAIAARQATKFPPFAHILKLTCSYKQEAAAIKATRQLADHLKQVAGKSVTILGPTPAFYERLRGNYRWQLVVKSSRRSILVGLIDHLPASHWQYDLDPSSLL